MAAGGAGLPTVEQALAAYRQAVTLDPTLAEAHLRLGHVLLLTGKAGRGRRGVRAGLRAKPATSAGAISPRCCAPTAPTRAAIAPRRGSAIRPRSTAWPDAQSPVLALSRIEASTGDWPAAQARLATLSPRAGGRAEDPWWAYGFGQAWRIDAGLATLRRLVVR